MTEQYILTFIKPTYLHTWNTRMMYVYSEKRNYIYIHIQIKDENKRYLSVALDTAQIRVLPLIECWFVLDFYHKASCYAYCLSCYFSLDHLTVRKHIH